MAKALCYLVLLCWAVAMVLASASGRSSYPRANRGFKNAQLSTARGFGKRDRDTPISLQQEGIFTSEGRTYPVAWLVEEIQNNPEMARLIVERFVDENGDGELTPEELYRKLLY